MLTFTTLGTFAGATTVTAAAYWLLNGQIGCIREHWLVWALAELIVIGHGLAVGPVTVGNSMLWVLNGILVAATTAGTLHLTGLNSVRGPQVPS